MLKYILRLLLGTELCSCGLTKTMRQQDKLFFGKEFDNITVECHNETCKLHRCVTEIKLMVL